MKPQKVGKNWTVWFETHVTEPGVKYAPYRTKSLTDVHEQIHKNYANKPGARVQTVAHDRKLVESEIPMCLIIKPGDEQWNQFKTK